VIIGIGTGEGEHGERSTAFALEFRRAGRLVARGEFRSPTVSGAGAFGFSSRRGAPRRGRGTDDRARQPTDRLVPELPAPELPLVCHGARSTSWIAVCVPGARLSSSRTRRSELRGRGLVPRDGRRRACGSDAGAYLRAPSPSRRWRATRRGSSGGARARSRARPFRCAERARRRRQGVG
jgi:hypothetical protein